MDIADFYLMSYDSDYTTGQTVWVSNLGRGKEFFTSKMSISALGPTQPPIQLVP